jgi:hypothetical protein
MPKYYFHIRDGSALIEDLEGMELPDIGSVHTEAIEAAREIMADRIRSGKTVDGQEFLVFDEDGRQVEIIPFKAGLEPD